MPGESVADQGVVSVQSTQNKKGHLEEAGRISFQYLADLQADEGKPIERYLEENGHIPAQTLREVLEATRALYKLSAPQ